MKIFWCLGIVKETATKVYRLMGVRWLRFFMLNSHESVSIIAITKKNQNINKAPSPKVGKCGIFQWVFSAVLFIFPNFAYSNAYIDLNLMKKREKILLAMLCHPSHCGPHLVGVFHFHFVSKSARFNYVNERTTAPPLQMVLLIVQKLLSFSSSQPSQTHLSFSQPMFAGDISRVESIHLRVFVFHFINTYINDSDKHKVIFTNCTSRMIVSSHKHTNDMKVRAQTIKISA